MNIQYTYEIIAVDQAARCMEVVYSSEGRQTMHIGARLPFEGESLEAVIQMYAPLAYWREQETPTIVVEVGHRGSMPLQGADNSLAAVKARKVAELADARYAYEQAGVMVNGLMIRTDRESRAAINMAYAGLKDGLFESIDWKGANDQWAKIGLAGITEIARAVAQHVQLAFAIEGQLTSQVAAASTVEQVEEVKWPA
jgi:hypothetical protein